MGAEPNKHERLEELLADIDGVITAAVVPHASGATFEVQVYTEVGVSEDNIRRQIAAIIAGQGKLQEVEAVHVFVLWAELSEEERRAQQSIGQGAGGGESLQVLDVPGEAAPAPGQSLQVLDVPGEAVAAAEQAGAELPAIRALEEPHEPGAAPTGDRGDGTGPGPGARPKLAKISYRQSGGASEAHVALRIGDREVEGTGRGRATPYALRVAAATALEAAQAVIGEKGWLQLEGVSLMRIFNRPAVLVLVQNSKGGGMPLLGAALVGDGPPYEAAVRAALDAVNRQLEVMLAG